MAGQAVRNPGKEAISKKYEYSLVFYHTRVIPPMPISKAMTFRGNAFKYNLASYYVPRAGLAKLNRIFRQQTTELINL